MPSHAPNHAPRHYPTRASLAIRVRRVGQAIDRRDEDAARAELRLLADEANLLATCDPFPLSPPHNSLERRQRIAAEADKLGAIG